MRALALPVILAAMLIAPAPSRADMLVGVATVNGLKGINLEKTAQWGSVYLLAGAYQSNTGFELAENLTGIVGFRRFQERRYDQNAYFGGGFAGDLDGGPDYSRYGAGGELGYQWVTEHLRITMQGGLALMGEPSRGARPNSTEIEPILLLGASISLRF